MEQIKGSKKYDCLQLKEKQILIDTVQQVEKLVVGAEPSSPTSPPASDLISTVCFYSMGFKY